MLKHNQLVVFRAFGEGDPVAEPGAQPNIQESPEFQEALKAGIAQALASETTGLKSKISEALGEKKKLQEQLNSILAQAQDKEDQEALKAGKIDVQSLIDKRVSAANASWQERLQAEQSEKDELRKAVDAEKGRLKSFQIKHLIGQEALKNEFFQPTALEDLIALAGGSWDLSDQGELISRDQHGNIKVGKAGKALTPKEWIEDLAGARPHYFKNLPGSGGKQGAGGAGRSITKSDWQKLLLNSSEKEAKELLSKRNSGEIVIV